jgi:hypothetical protein
MHKQQFSGACCIQQKLGTPQSYQAQEWVAMLRPLQQLSWHEYIQMQCISTCFSSGGVVLHVDTLAHSKSGIAYQDKSRRPETFHKREPHWQPLLSLT